MPQARLRRERELLVLRAQQPEQPAHLGQRLLPGRLDRARAPRAGARCRGRVDCCAACDWITITLTLWATTSCSSRAIRVRSSATAARVASRSSSSRTARSRAPGVLLAAAEPAAAEPGPDHEDARERVVGEVVVGDGDLEPDRGEADHPADQRAPRRLALGGREDRDEQDDERHQRAGRGVDQAPRRERRRRHGQRRERRAAPPQQRGRHREQGDRGERLRALLVLDPPDPDLELRGDAEPERDEPVAARSRDVAMGQP